MTVRGGDVVRLREWRRIREFASRGRPRPAALMVIGEPGAGKSTLWRAGVAAAAEAGQRVLRSEPSAAEAELPFTGLSDLFTDVLPEVADGIPDPQREALEVTLLARPAGDAPPTARAVNLAVLTLLRGLAEAGPVLVAIDDVHWLDEASLDALTYAFRRLDHGPVSLLLAARTEAPADPLTVTTPPPPHGWEDLAAAVPAETVELGPLEAPAHPLIGAAALELLPPARRTQLSQQLAGSEDGAERSAHFAALAAGPGPNAEVAAALDAAAEAAHKRAGNTEAAQFAVQAVQFTSGQDRQSLASRRIRAAELLFLAGDVHLCLDQAAAVDLGQLAAPDLERLLPLLLDLTDVVRGQAAATEIVTRLARTSSPDPRRRAPILAQASDVAYGIPSGRQAAAIEAIRAAEEAGAAADTSLHRALINLVIVKANAAQGLDEGLLDRAEQLEGRSRLDRLHDSADVCRGLWSRYAEDLDTSRAALNRSIELAREASDDFSLATFLSYLAATEELAGDYQTAREALAGVDAAAAWFDTPLLPLVTRCNLLIADGDLDGAWGLAEQYLPDTSGQRAGSRFRGHLVRGRVSAWRGDTAEAAGFLEAAARWADESGWLDPGVRQGLDTELAEVYLADGRSGDAQPITARLREIGQRLGRPVLTGNAARIDAQAAALDGDLEAAAEAARQAVTAHETTTLRPELARSLLVLGQVERRRRARSQSRDALTRAHDLARDIGHRPLLALIEQELPRVAASRSGDELTATEQQVAELIAAGATNREAAAALFVSVRTVETHTASIYRKLGVRSRAELARRFPRVG